MALVSRMRERYAHAPDDLSPELAHAAVAAHNTLTQRIAPMTR